MRLFVKRVSIPSQSRWDSRRDLSRNMGLEELFEELSKSTRCAAKDLSEKQPAFNGLVLSSNLRRPMDAPSLRRLEGRLRGNDFGQSAMRFSPAGVSPF